MDDLLTFGKNNKYTGYGVIGKSGKFYPCNFQEHIETQNKNKVDSPFLTVYIDHCPPVVLHDFGGMPTRHQFETVIDICTEIEEKFENVAIGLCWDEMLGA